MIETTYPEFLETVRINTKGKIISFDGDNLPEIKNVLSWYENNENLKIRGNTHRYDSVFIDDEKLLKQIVKDINLKYSIQLLPKLGVKSIVLKEANSKVVERYEKEKFESKVFKVSLNEHNFIKHITLRAKQNGGKPDVIQVIEPKVYEKICKILGLESELIIKSNEGFIPTDTSYRKMIVVDDNGNLINPTKKDKGDVLDIVTFIGVANRYFEGKFSVSFVNDNLLKVIALEDSFRNDKEIFKGFEFYISAALINDMH